MTQRIILDIDTGTDDAVAILLAVLGTTVASNCALDHVTEHTLRVLDVLGRTASGVYAGMAAPLVRPDIQRGAWSTILDLPPARSRAQAQHAVAWLIDTLRHSDGDIVLVGVAPLTNIFHLGHYAFRVDAGTFDAVLERSERWSLDFGSEPGQHDNQINHRGGGRGMYVRDVDGNSYEFLTAVA